MSKIIPFKALIPKADLASNVLCPPYDVLTSDEARIYAKDNPLSFLHITKAEIDLDRSVNEYDSLVYEKARENLKKFEEDGLLISSDSSFYIYRQIMEGHVQTGIVCGASVDEYEKGLKIGIPLSKGKYPIKMSVGTTVSIIPHCICTLTTKGLFWELKNQQINPDGLLAIRNRSTKEWVEFNLTEGKALIVIDIKPL